MKPKLILLVVLLVIVFLPLIVNPITSVSEKYLVYNSFGSLEVEVFTFEGAKRYILEYSGESMSRTYTIWRATKVCSVFVTFPTDPTLRIKEIKGGSK